MKLSLNWARDFVDIDLPPEELASRLTDATAEVEGYEVIGAHWEPDKVIVGQVTRVDPHPNADRLRLATVETGDGEETVVCGAPNVAAGQKVAFAREGAELVDGHTGKRSKLKLRPIRGVESAGMVLSEKELGLSEDHEGILVLPERAEVGRPLTEQIGDVVFDISTWANRADLLGVYGLAREIAAITGRELHPIDRAHGEMGPAVEDFVSIDIESPDLCRRFTASVVEGVTVEPSPPWLQERLIRMGQRPINNIVDITNYIMLETGQPIHAFDYDLVRGQRIVVRRPRPGETITTLDDVERELDPDVCLICDAEGPIAIGGVMGGANSEVSENTRRILVEVANFEPGSIRKTSMKLKLRTEASSRFEKGIGPDTPEFVQHRTLRLLEDVTGGTVARGVLDVYPGMPVVPEIELTTERIEQVLGMEIPRDEIARILGALGFEYTEEGTGHYRVTPPWWRTDVAIADDIIEDLGRVYGYDKLPTTVLRGELPAVPITPVQDVREQARDLFVAAGFQEAINYTLSTPEVLDPALPGDDSRRRNPLRVMNPVASQHAWLRTTLRPSLLQNYANNRRRYEGPLRFFEIGFEYLPREDDLPHERTVVCAILGGPRQDRWAAAESEEHLDFFDAKGAVEAVLHGLRVEATWQAQDNAGLLQGHTARVAAGKDTLGWVGQVHPDLAREYDIDHPVFIVELGVEELARNAAPAPRYAPVSRFPAVRQDLALLLDETTPAAEVLERIRQTKLVTAADVFDEYRGEGVPAGKKSLAIRVLYQAPDRTLTDKDVAKVRDGIVKRLERDLGATLRG